MTPARSTRAGTLTLLVVLGAGLLLHLPLSSPTSAAPGGLEWGRFGTAQPVATSSPALPPPAPYLHLLPRFFDLLESYVALDAGDKVPFAAWVVLNGITDPRMIDGLVSLYEWYHRAIRAA